MRLIRLTALAAALAVLAGCSTISVNQDYDREADFSTYGTYAWVPQQTTAIGDAKAAKTTNTLLDKRIRNAVNAELQAKGMSIDTEDPDLLIAYHVGVDQKINVTDWGYSYPHYYGGWGGSNIDVTNYNEGTLIVDLIEYETKELVWRGTATKVLEENPSPERAEKNLQEVVRKIFDQYPPKM